VSLEAVKALKRKGVDIVSVIEFSPGLSDVKVLDLANREDRVLVTFDKDFGELVVRERANVKGLILLRFTPKSSENVANTDFTDSSRKQSARCERVYCPRHQIKILKSAPLKFEGSISDGNRPATVNF
jgi:predicted nuclease of predicted toxin-antitoxin system